MGVLVGEKDVAVWRVMVGSRLYEWDLDNIYVLCIEIINRYYSCFSSLRGSFPVRIRFDDLQIDDAKILLIPEMQCSAFLQAFGQLG